MTLTKESAIEKAVCAYARGRGWLVMKLNGDGNRGKPDRLFLRNGKAIFIEFKAPHKRPTKLQQKHLNELQAQGFTAFYCNDAQQGIDYFRQQEPQP